MQINTNKKYASTVGMKNSQYSAIIYISYDMPDRVESKYHVSGIVYREKQAWEDPKTLKVLIGIIN